MEGKDDVVELDCRQGVVVAGEVLLADAGRVVKGEIGDKVTAEAYYRTETGLAFESLSVKSFKTCSELTRGGGGGLLSHTQDIEKRKVDSRAGCRFAAIIQNHLRIKR